MIIHLPEGLLSGINCTISPHCDDRPANALIDMVVIHGISLPAGEFGTGAIQGLFLNSLDYTKHHSFIALKEFRVSAHLLIDRKGELTQFVPFSKRAWHAGKSFFQGKENCNDFSIGIELEGTDQMPYEHAQYRSLAKILTMLMQSYPAIKRERVVGHSDIAPGRKTDPGPCFDWAYLDTLLDL